MPDQLDLRLPARCARVAVGVGIIGVAALAWMLFDGHAGLAAPRYTSDFYDLQARALLDGHWDIRPGEALGIEAIVTDGRSHTYFGPLPSILRMPVLALTDSLDGRLSQPSMLLASVLVAVMLTRIGWAARVVGSRGGEPDRPSPALVSADWSTALALGTWLLVTMLGSIVVYLVSLPAVYHEALLWGAALSLWAYDSQIRLVVRPSTTRVLMAGVTTFAALLTRASVGVGPLVSLGLLSLWGLWRTIVARRTARRTAARDLSVLGVDAGPLANRWWQLALGGMVAVGAYVAVNVARFGLLYQLPLDRQVYSGINANRQAVLAENGGSIFGLRYIPTTLWQYVRPDNLRVHGWYPATDFGPPATVVGDVTFDTISRSASLTTTTPLLLIAAVVGVGALIGGRRVLGPFVAPIIGAFVATVPALAIAFVAHRYLGDLFPLLVLAAVLGWWWGFDRIRGLPRIARGAMWVAVLALGAWSIIANVGLAIVNQDLYSARTPDAVAEFVDDQYSLPRADHAAVLRRDSFDDVGGAATDEESQTLLVVGDCEGLYVSDGERWVLVEAAAANRDDVEVDPDDLDDTPRELGPFRLSRAGDTVSVRGDEFDATIELDDDRTLDLAIVTDPVADTVQLIADDRVVLSLDGSSASTANDPVFRERQGRGTPVCQRVLELDGGSSS